MASFFAKLTAQVTAAAAESLSTLNSMTAQLSLDHLQEKFGVDEQREGLRNLDITYLTPRLIGEGGAFPWDALAG
jgi:hypothetical protein